MHWIMLESLIKYILAFFLYQHLVFSHIFPFRILNTLPLIILLHRIRPALESLVLCFFINSNLLSSHLEFIKNTTDRTENLLSYNLALIHWPKYRKYPKICTIYRHMDISWLIFVRRNLYHNSLLVVSRLIVGARTLLESWCRPWFSSNLIAS